MSCGTIGVVGRSCSLVLAPRAGAVLNYDTLFNEAQSIGLTVFSFCSCMETWAMSCLFASSFGITVGKGA